MNTRSNRSKLGLLLALSLVAVSAMAAHQESTEFRRGYEQGFRDAMEGRRPQYGRYSSIDIHTAIYGAQGRRGQTCNAKPALQAALDNRWSNDRRDNDRNYDGSRRGFSILVGDQLCGDPSPSRAKTLVVTYRCGNSELTRVTTAEGNRLRIRCEED